MIDVYLPGNENFTKNGDMPLAPVYCTITATINGAWTLNLAHPIDAEGRWKYIQEGAVLRVPSFNGEQLFRISRKEKQDGGIIAEASPIFLDAIGDCFLIDKRPTNKNGQQALDDILSANSKYKGVSNITKTSTAYYELKNAMEAIAGEEENSFLNRWGGEIAFNNFEIQIMEELGEDRGVQILYGKNIPVDGIKETVSLEDVATRLIPKAYGGRMLPGEEPWIDSPIITAYPTIHTRVLELPDLVYRGDLEWEPADYQTVYETLPELYKAMEEAVLKEYEAGADKPYINLECDMVMLQTAEEYAEFKDLEKVSLGDTVHCKHRRLEIESDARIVSLTYDSCRKAVQNVTIGQATKNYLDRVVSTIAATEKAITKSGTVVAGQIKGFIDGAEAQLKIQNSRAKRVDAVALLIEDADPESPTFGALGVGTQGLQLARQKNGDQWEWGTAITSEGIIANYIVAGLLSDKKQFNFWNLDTGEFSLSADAKVGGQTVQEIAGAAVSAQTQQEIFDKLTNNGQSQGIYLADGQLYINGTYIKSGLIDADLIRAGIIRDREGKNYWNLDDGEFYMQSGTIRGAKISGSEIEGSVIRSMSPDGPKKGWTTIRAGFLNTDWTNPTAGRTRTQLGADGLIVTSEAPEGASGNNDAETQITNGVYVYSFLDGEIDDTKPRTAMTRSAYTGRATEAGASYFRLGYYIDMTSPELRLLKDSNNYALVTPDNIRIYKNGALAWSAI